MIRPGISKQIIIIAVLPALIVASILSTYYVTAQYDYLSASLSENGTLVAKQLSPVAEYAVYSGNTDFIRPLVNTIIQSDAILRIQILDKDNNSILDIKKPENKALAKRSIPKKFIADIFNIETQQLIFVEPIISAQINLIDYALLEKHQTIVNKPKKFDDNQVGKVIITLTTRHTAEEQIQRIHNSILITLLVILLTTLIVIRLSRNITRPIQSLIQTVREISSGNLNAHIELNSTGELGILESCINQMKNELKASQTNLELQLDTYTKELQQTLEELEIRNVELDITRTKAINASNAKSEFLANMSHEIRTPLSGIIGFTELLQGTPLSNQQKDYASTIEKSSKSLLHIINDILDLSKIESGKTVITNSEFNVVDIIEDIINLLSPTALDKDIELYYLIEKNVPNKIRSDPFRIHQILTNLIGNAIKFTEKGYVLLQVTAEETDKVEPTILFKISDTGIGMSKSDKQKLFKAFTQADTSITRRFGGTGLGLVISRKLTLLMNGEMGFDSTEGKGSSFWFCVPIIPVPEECSISEIAFKKIALICNHIIARHVFNTLFVNAQCIVRDYSVSDLTQLDDIENNNDVIVLLLSHKEINEEHTKKNINKLFFSIPSLLIVSTRSHTKLKELQKNIFDDAVFTSEKTETIKQKIINLIHKNETKVNLKNISVDNTKHTKSADWSNIRVMIVDDNEVNLRLAEILLNKHSAQVTTAVSGEQALDYIRMGSFDIIFMDLHMPGLDGYATTAKIRKITRNNQPVIIALTANALPQEQKKVIKSGMNGILIKPVSDIMLQKVLNQWALKSIKNTVINEPESYRKNQANTLINTEDKKGHGIEQKKNIFSIEIAKKFTGNNEELAYELFSMLRADLDDYRESITIAVKNNDLKKLYEQVHKLHGASRCCGTTELMNTSSHIENLINKNSIFDIEKETRGLINAINSVIEYKL